VNWISVPLLVEEKKALHLLAERERRDSRSQAALIIRQELIRQGYFKFDPDIPQIESDAATAVSK
jgi:hypothetical protein